MPTEVIMPRVDMDMTEGTITDWHVKEGDEVRQGAPVFDIETSKAAMEIEAPASGLIRQIGVPIGETVAVGTVVAWIYARGEALQEHAAAAPSAPEPAEQEREPVAEVGQEPQPVAVATESQRVRATPAARRVARERGLTLESIAGTGPHGRIGLVDAMRMADLAPARSASRLNTVWLRKGAGAPLVMLHGFAAESNSWRPFGNALSRLTEPDVGMLGIDLPAHGKSSADAGGSLDDIVAAIEATLSAEGISACHLLGHSFGGGVAIAMAAKAAKAAGIEVRSLSLLAPAGLGPESNGDFIRGVTQATRRGSLVPWLKVLFADPSHLDEAFIATAEQQLGRAEVRGRLAALADVFFPDGVQSLDLRGALDTLTMPVKIVWGQRDRVLPPRHADGLAGRIGVHRFAAAGHLPQIEAQDDVAAIVAWNIRSAPAASVAQFREVGNG